MPRKGECTGAAVGALAIIALFIRCLCLAGEEGSYQRLIHHQGDLAFDLADWLALYGRLTFDSAVPYSPNKEP